MNKESYEKICIAKSREKHMCTHRESPLEGQNGVIESTHHFIGHEDHRRVGDGSKNVWDEAAIEAADSFMSMRFTNQNFKIHITLFQTIQESTIHILSIHLLKATSSHLRSRRQSNECTCNG